MPFRLQRLQAVNKFFSTFRRLLPAVLSLVIMHAGTNSYAEAIPDQQTGLATAIQETLKNHPAIQGKLAEVEGKGYAADSARAGRYPNLSAQASLQEDDSKLGSVVLQQPIWSFGKIDIPIELADADILAELTSLLQLQRKLIEDTATTYATLEGIQLREQVASSNIEELDRLYQHVQRRQKGQLASDVDVRLAYSRLTQAKARHLRIQGELRITQSELKNLTQVEVDTSIPIDLSLLEIPDYAVVEQNALDNSAEVLYKLKLVELGRLEVDRERVSDLPTLYVNVEHDLMDSANTADDTRVSVVLEGRIQGLGFAGVARTKQAASRLTAAKQDLTVTRNDIKQRVSSLMSNLNIQNSLTLAQQESVEALDETLSSYMRQYESGRKTWLEVLNTQRELTEQRIQLVQTQNDYLVTTLRISALTGMLDSISGIKANNNNEY